MLLVLMLFSAVAGAWVHTRYLRPCPSATLGIERDLHDLKLSVQALTNLVRDQGELHLKSAAAFSAEQSQQTQGFEQLAAAHAQLAARVTPSGAPQASDVVLSKLARLETAVSNKILPHLDLVQKQLLEKQQLAPSHAGGSVGATARTAHPTTARADGTVQVTFRLTGAAGAAALFWLGRGPKADGTLEHEVKYTEIPHGMQAVETTRPGECWRAVDPKSGKRLLEMYCATIEPKQQVLIQ